MSRVGVLFVVCSLWALLSSAQGKTKEEWKAEMMDHMKDCNAELKITEAEITKTMKSHGDAPFTALPRKFKCLFKCYEDKNFGSSTYDEARHAAITSFITDTHNDMEQVRKLNLMHETCKNSGADEKDECEKAAKMFDCRQQEGKKLGLKEM